MAVIKEALYGMARLRVKGAMPESFLNGCAYAGLEVADVKRLDPFTVELKTHASQLRKSEEIAKSCFCDIELVSSGRSLLHSFRRKILTIIMLAILTAIVFWSKFYVWEIEVNGNENISDGEILGALSQCGVESGAFWPSFSADSIRSEVLYLLPELSWITVNMHGSLAEVTVVERNSPPETVYEGECSNIVSDKDAFVIEVNTLEGKSIVRSGDAVKKGDVLITGIVESSYSPPRYLRSLGSIKAETNNSFTAVSPSLTNKRILTGKKNIKFALIIGDKRINFYSDSSISENFCDKIISVWSLEIEGVIKLPLSIVSETSYHYELEETECDNSASSEKLIYCLKDTLSREIKDGEILSEKLNFSRDDGLILSTLRVRCIEKIGVSVAVSDEEIAESKLKFSQKADDE